MPNNGASYFLHSGMPIGFQYRLAKRFAKALGVRLEVIVPRRQKDLIELLNSGHADMLAATLTITPERRKLMTFSRPLSVVDEVLVQRADTPAITKIEDLAGQRIHARRSSAYWRTLTAIQKRVPTLKLIAAPETLETEALIAQVRDGRIPFTVADFDIVAVELAFSDALRASLVLKKGVHRAFAVRGESKRLLAAINRFVKSQRSSVAGSGPVATPKSSKSRPVGRDLHTPFDAAARTAAKANGLDPRLLITMVELSSEFAADAVSPTGGIGLLQLPAHIPMQVGLSGADLKDPKDNLAVGARYLAMLLRNGPPTLTKENAQRFALAAFKLGWGHVEDARRLAQTTLGLDPTRWDGHVAKALALLSHPRYAELAQHGYCRGEDAVAFVAAVEQILASR
jgi:membrane-bound lytic murein transglycosylase F